MAINQNNQFPQPREKQFLQRLLLHSFDVAKDMIYLTDSRGKLISVNPSTEDVLEYPPSYLINDYIWLIDSSVTQNGWSEFFNRLYQEKNLRFETELTSSSGKNILCESMVHFFPVNGGNISAFSLVTLERENSTRCFYVIVN